MIKEFIKQNTLSFRKGQRNSTVTTLIGYAQHLKMTDVELKAELSTQISRDSFIKEEIDRLWGYCKSNKYKDFWTTADARKQYTF